MSSRRSIHLRDAELWEQFTEHPAPLGAKVSLVSCRHCTKYQRVAVNPYRMRQHLYKCPEFYNNPTNANNSIVKDRKRSLEGQESKNVYSSWMQTGGYTQTKLAVPKISPQEQEVLTELASLAIYVGGKPLSFFEEHYLRAFINRLNPSYAIPSRKQFAGELLDKAYNAIRALVQIEVDQAETLNLITDSSANVNHDRIVNISLHTPMGALYLESLESDELRHGGQETADHVARRVSTWCSDTTKINSITTDTENKMKAFINALHLKPDWKHVFWAPCDSHGLQLLMMHISEIKWFKDLFSRGGKIAAFFHRADKQLKILRDAQITIYKRHYALTLSVVTRWGTQYRLIHSLTRSRQALQLYATDLRTDRSAAASVIEIIQDPQFWADLEDLKLILKDIHEAQIQSESLHAHLGFVYTRWRDIKAHLRRLASNTLFPPHNHVAQIFARRPVKEGGPPIGLSVWDTQYAKQILPIHIVAYHLDPVNLGHGMNNDAEQNMILQFLTQYTVGTADQKQRVRADFLAFKLRQPPFTRNHLCWQDQNNVILFWTIATAIAPKLGRLAVRVFLTAANSVACERAFSIMKILHTKARNRTGIEKMDKLQFIYINTRILRYRNERIKASLPPDDPDGPNKRQKTNTEEEEGSWLVLDEDTELAVEEEYLPVPQMTYTQQEEAHIDVVELDPAVVADDVSHQSRTSDIHGLLNISLNTT